MSEGVTLKGRERELASLQRVLDANGPRVAFVYGVAGIGKSALLEAFASGVRGTGTPVWRIDCAAIDPTESSFRAALDAAGWQPGSAGVVLVDTYEMFRIADPWLRHELVSSLSTELRFVIAGRDAPMLEWSTERGRVGGLEILPLVGLTDEASQAFLADANVAEQAIEGHVSVFLPGDTAPGGVEGTDRRTAIGRLIRRTSIDELPQLFNVLKGEMSIVGPRPERPEFVQLFERRVDRYEDRHRVKSGITGWAQVHGLRGKTSLSDRIELDNFYIENWSLWLDCKILVMTVGAVVHAAE